MTKNTKKAHGLSFCDRIKCPFRYIQEGNIVFLYGAASQSHRLRVLRDLSGDS